MQQRVVRRSPWQECRNTFYNPKTHVNVLFEILNTAVAPVRKTSHMSSRHCYDGEAETTYQTGNRNTVTHSGTWLATVTEYTMSTCYCSRKRNCSKSIITLCRTWCDSLNLEDWHQIFQWQTLNCLPLQCHFLTPQRATFYDHRWQDSFVRREGSTLKHPTTEYVTGLRSLVDISRFFPYCEKALKDNK